MEINYIILAHQSPPQLARLLEKLTTSDSRFYIHIDKDVECRPFRHQLSHLGNVFFLPDQQRISAIWADFGMVQATLNAIRQIVADRRKGYCVLLSGQDYPLKNSACIDEFFTRHNGFNFIQACPILPSENPEQDSRRITRYKVNLSKTRNDLLVFPSVFDKEFYRELNLQSFVYLAKRKSIVSCLGLLPATLRKRRFPSYVQPYKGSQWWALPIDTIRFIDDFIHEHPDYRSFHRYTFAPDEIFFQSIIYSRLDKASIRPELTYVSWAAGNSSPLILKERDLDEIMQKGREKLFARKFDMDTDPGILDLIDRETG